MTDWTEIPDLLHHQFTLDNCDEAELELLADHNIPGAETALSCRLALRRLAALKLEEKAKRAKAQAEHLTAAGKAAKGLFS